MTESTERQTDSETTGPRRLGNVLPNVIGSPPGETGSVATPMMVEAATARLVNSTPRDTDSNLRATLRQQHGISLEPETRWMFPPDRPAYKKTMGIRARVSDTCHPEKALEAARLSLFPAATETLVKAIAELKAKTKSRAQGEMDMGMEIATYEKELRNYPADVALEGLRLAAEQSMWFPSWFEMKEILDRLYTPRRLMIDRLVAMQR